MRILSIDPGYERLGIAVLEKKEPLNKEEVLYSDCFKTNSKDSFETRLKEIGGEVEKIINKYKTEALAIESLFFNSNQKTAFNVSEVKGAIKYIALKKGLEVKEFTPLQIKIACTGYGRSTKNQVTSMVCNLIKVDKKINYDDEYDAIAIGLTYFAYNQKI